MYASWGIMRSCLFFGTLDRVDQPLGMLQTDDNIPGLSAYSSCTGDEDYYDICQSVQGNEKDIVVSEDDGIRPGVTPQALAGLKPVFKKGGTTTAGNSSQVRCQILIISSRCSAFEIPLVAHLCSCALASVMCAETCAKRDSGHSQRPGLHISCHQRVQVSIVGRWESISAHWS